MKADFPYNIVRLGTRLNIRKLQPFDIAISLQLSTPVLMMMQENAACTVAEIQMTRI